MSPRRRVHYTAASALTVLAALAGTVSGTGSAAAAVSDCSAATVQYRALDAQGNPTEKWTSAGGFHGWASAPTAVQVRLAADQRVGEGCRYPVSLAAYRTEGPNWGTSGHQTFLDSATVYLTGQDMPGESDSEAGQKLQLKAVFGDCYGQIDLYGNDTVYDGGTAPGHGPLPYQPGNVVTPNNLIAAWNGGSSACAEETPSDSPSASAPETTPSTGTQTPSPSGSVTPEPSSSQPATASPSTAAPQPSSSGGGAPTPSTNPTVSPAPSGSATPATSAAPTTSPTQGPDLAETGAGDTLGLLGGGVAVLLVGGGALVLARRRAGRHSS